MAFIRYDRFLGELPRFGARLLPQFNAQSAINCDLQSGELRPLNTNLTITTPTKTGTKLSIFKWVTFWFHWTTDVDVARSPVVGDTTERVYFTGDGVPKMTFSPDATSGGGTDYPTVSFTLGIPAPASALTATLVVNTGSITGATQANPVVITSASHGRTTGEQIDIASIAGMTELNGRTFNLTVIDANSFSLDSEDGTGHTAYTSGGTWTQTYDSADVRDRAYVYTYVSASGEQGPPSPVSNIVTAGPGQQVNLSGMAVGPAGAYDIQDKYIYRAEDGDYQWTGEVVLATTTFSDTVDEADLGEILPSDEWVGPPSDGAGMVMSPNGIGAMFSGKDLYLSEPYQPHAYPIRYIQPLTYDIVAIAAIGTDIIAATKGTPSIVTCIDPAMASEDKLALEAPCVSKRSMVDMGSFAMWATPEGLAAVGAGIEQIVSRAVMDPEDWALLVPSSIHAYQWRGRYVVFYDTGVVQGGFIFDPRPGEEALVKIDDYATAGYHNKEGGELFLQIGADIVQFDGGTTSRTQTWHGPIVRQTAQTHNIGKVDADAYPVTLKLIADGVTKHTETVADKEPFPMPDNYAADEWEIELSGTQKITSATIATSMEELKRALEL